MKISSRKRISRPLALAAGLSAVTSALCCLAFASTSAMAYKAPAGLPPSGVNCNTTEGKISGRGSTYQEEAQQKTFSVGFTNATCAKEVGLEGAGDPAEHTMVTYNYPEAKAKSVTGSGAGIRAASCRTDAFAGTDIPYSNAELATFLDGAPGNEGGCTIATGFTPPYQPQSPWPNAGDKEAKAMTFPIGGSSIGFLVHLTSASCGGSAPPTSFQFTPLELSRIFGGDALTWNDAELVKNNPGLSVCTAAIQRVVRQDNSGTTTITKNTFVNELPRPKGVAEPFEEGVVLNNREGSNGTCATGKKWEAYYPSPNTNWPKASEGGTCSPEAIHGASSGNLETIAELNTVTNGVAYADLPQAENNGVTEDHFVLASVRNATGKSYQTPNVGKAANCVYSSLSLPGLNGEEAVGLNLEDNWSNNNQAAKPVGNEKPQHGIPNLTGEKYPVCGLTWDMVYTHDASSSDAKVAIAPLTADQRMTEYAYFSWILNEEAQKLLGEAYYAGLPASWLSTLREGFQNCFGATNTSCPLEE